MMGNEESQEDKFIYNFRLSKRIPLDHPLRKIRDMLDLDFLYDLLKRKYGTRGNVSVPPPVLMKMMLLLVFYNVRSERELMRTIPMRLDWIWFLGYDLDDDIPHHSVLSKARKRWGEAVFKELFERILLQAAESGLVDGGKLFADSSLVEADASRNSVKRISNMKLASTYKELLNRLDEGESEDEEEPGDKGNEGGRYSKVNKIHKSDTDPEATIVRQQGSSDLYYKVHRSVDERCEVITCCHTTTGIVNEAHVLKDLIDGHKAILGCDPGIIVADSKYGTKENFVKLKKRGIKTHIKDLSMAQKEGGSRKGKFSKEDFEYNIEGDYFVCPGGEKLKKRSYNPNRGWYEYKASKNKCDVCRLRLQCTADKNGRSLKRHPEEKYLQLAKQDAHSIGAKADLKKRQHLMERSFATGIRYGYKRARWRNMWRVSIQQYLIATVQNLQKIFIYGGDLRHNKAIYLNLLQKFSLKNCIFGILTKINLNLSVLNLKV